jgi:hypothetical protein
MKGIIVISLILLAGLASAYTPEQQTALEGINLSYKLGMAYAIATQGQNLTEYNALVDEYNAWIRQNFGEDTSLLKSKLNASEIPAPNVIILVTPANSGISYLSAPFNTSTDLSKFGKPMHLVAGEPAQSQEYSLIQEEQKQFLSAQ